MSRDPCACVAAGSDRLSFFLFWLWLATAILTVTFYTFAIIFVLISFEVWCLYYLSIGKRCRLLLIFLTSR